MVDRCVPESTAAKLVVMCDKTNELIIIKSHSKFIDTNYRFKLEDEVKICEERNGR